MLTYSLSSQHIDPGGLIQPLQLTSAASGHDSKNQFKGQKVTFSPSINYLLNQDRLANASTLGNKATNCH